MEENNKIGFFKRMAIAIAKPKEYDKLSKQRTRNTILTIVILSVIQTLVLFGLLIFLGSSLISILDEKTKIIPDFTLSNQGLTVQMESPFVYKTEDNTILVIVDSAINMEEIKNNYSSDIFSATDYILISNDQLVVRTATQKDYFEFSQLPEEKIYTKQSVIELYHNALNSIVFKVICVVIAIMICIYFIIANIFMGLIYSVIAIIVTNIEKKKINYKRLYNISIYAQVTTILLSMIQLLTFIVIPFWGAVKSIIICLYIIFGIKGCKEDDDTKEDKKIIGEVEKVVDIENNKKEEESNKKVEQDNEEETKDVESNEVDEENKGEN